MTVSSDPSVPSRRSIRSALTVCTVVVAALSSGLMSPFTAPGVDAATAQTARTVHLYFIALNNPGLPAVPVGCGDGLVAVNYLLAPTTTPLGVTMRLLLANHTAYFGQSGLYNPLYRSNLILQRATIVKGHATVRLLGVLRLGGECDDPRVSAQLRRTAFQFSGVHSVSILVNGTPLKHLLSGKG